MVSYVLVGSAILLVVGNAMKWMIDRLWDDPAPPGEPPQPPSAPPRPPPPAALAGDPPTFRVVALGLEGAGKTVLLASMFHRLRSLPDTPAIAGAASWRARLAAHQRDLAGDRRYYFAASGFEQDRWLTDVYRYVSDPDAAWPAPTQVGEPREFVFDCRALDGRGDEHTVFRVVYLDYAGDILEQEEAQTARRSLLENVAGADAVLVVVDAPRVCQAMDGEPAGDDYLRRMGPTLRLAGKASCPVQLVVTKWDAVAERVAAPGDDVALGSVAERLMSDGGFWMLRHAHRHRGLRTIPVSAVGPDFAAPDADGAMVKRSDGSIEPYNVELPLFAVLPDVLALAERSLDADVRRDLALDLRGRMLRGAEIVQTVLTSPIGARVRHALAAVIGDSAMQLLIEMCVRRQSDELPPSGGRAAAASDDELVRRLRGDVVAHMQRVVSRLEGRLGSSIPEPELWA